MTFLVGELAAEIRLDGMQRYERDLQTAGRQMGALEKATAKATQMMRGGFATAATALTATGAATTALGVSLFRTGAAYNTLQQTSRAALRTLLGGAEAANAQMDKLDAFARTSPFAKSTFITAQQQLLGFGMAAEKVIPTLDAVQNAVAATGGSSQQLSEITFVLAQIQAAGKITAQDLMQLGQRGIDAATIIGSQMGKTGAEIREDISNGALAAGDALDALTTGLSAKFAGASANVKNTIEGAKDRIKAATREIGAALAEPFISQQGGGMAVTWGNQVADVLQGIRGHAKPVVGILIDELMPAFAGITQTLDKANVVVRSWDSSRLEAFLHSAQGYTPALAGVTGAVLGFNSSLLKSIPVLGAFVPALNPVAGALLGVAAASPEVREAAGEVLAALSPLIPAGVDLAKTLASGLNIALPIAADVLRAAAVPAGELAKFIAKIPAPVLAAVAAFVALRGPVTAGAEMLRRFGEQIAVQQGIARATGGALDATSRQVGVFGGAFAVAGAKASGAMNAIKAAFMSNPIGLVLTGVSVAVAGLTAAFAAQAERAAEVREKVAAYRETLTSATGEITAKTREMAREALNARSSYLWFETSSAAETAKKLGLSIADVTDAMLGNDAALTKVNAAMSSNQAATELSSLELNNLNDIVQTNAEATRTAAEETRRDAEEKRAAAEAMSDAARSNERFNEALSILRREGEDVASKLRALRQALDELNGGTRTQAELTRDLNEQQLSLADAFSVTDENGNKLASSLVLANGEIDTGTRAGIALHDQIVRLNDQMSQAVVLAAEDAAKRGESNRALEEGAAAAEPYIDSIRAIASEAGLSEEKVDGLISTMLDTPEVIAFLVTDQGSIDEKRQEALALAQQIIRTPDKEFTISSGSIPLVQQALDALGYKIVTLPDGQVAVRKDDGSFSYVNSSLDVLSRDRTVRIWASIEQAGGGGPGIAPASANGNLFSGGRAVPFADGGFPSGIYRGRPGGIHKFAEPETIWEAYISGRPSARERNKHIAKEAVARLGGVATFANGGITGKDAERLRDWMMNALRDWNTAQRRGENQAAGANGRGLSLVDKLLQISEQLSGKAADDLRKAALQSERAFLGLTKQSEAADAAIKKVTEREKAALDRANDRLDVAEKGLSKVTGALQSLKDKAASMASSVAQAVRGLFNVGDLGKPTEITKTRQVRESQTIGGVTLTSTRQETTTEQKAATAGSIAKSMAATAARLKRFADKLKKLAQKGLPPALVAEIAQVGVEAGEPIVDALLTASAAEVKSISDSYKTIGNASNQAGQTVSDANYAGLIDKAEKQVALAQRQVDAAERNVAAVKAQGEKALKAAEANAERIRKAMADEASRIIQRITDALRAGAGLPPEARPPLTANPPKVNKPTPPLTANPPKVSAPPPKDYGPLQAMSGDLDVVARALASQTVNVRMPVREPEPLKALPAPIREGDVYLQMPVVPEPGEPLPVQALRAAKRVEAYRKSHQTRRR
ncbi:tape measure protein [Microbacterium resistens]|nr:tape measure protein [Microbacterium resistens]MBW1640479.1 tape measure protein [Microbacterium resistens]